MDKTQSAEEMAEAHADWAEPRGDKRWSNIKAAWLKGYRAAQQAAEAEISDLRQRLEEAQSKYFESLMNHGTCVALLEAARGK